MSKFIEVIPYTESGKILRPILLNIDKIIHIREKGAGAAVVTLEEGEELFVSDYEDVAESIRQVGGFQ